MSSNAQKVMDFISNTKAFKNMPQDMLKLTKNKLLKGEWKVYKFKARVKNDDGYEGDMNPVDGEIFATYCWTGDSEYCATSKDFFDNMVSKSYQTVGEIVFEL